MRTTITLACATVALFASTGWAQLPARLKVPKLSSQPKAEPVAAKPEPTAKPAAAPPATAPDAPTEPTIIKDSVQITAFTLNNHRKNYKIYSWVPFLRFRVNGPIASGSQLYAEFTLPGATSPWVKFDCATGEIQKSYWWKTECGGRDIPEDQGALHTGVVNFALRMRNELAGTNATLFTGRMKVKKVRSNEHGPDFANHFVYFVDHDWNLPIGYAFFKPDDIKGMDRPTLQFSFWVRGDVTNNFEPHLFYQGKEVGKIVFQGEQVGRPSCAIEHENHTTHYVEDNYPQKAKWARILCTFWNVRGWDKTGEAPGMFGPLYTLSANPGEYELKVLWNNQLARIMKFTAGADGNLDFSLAQQNALGSRRAIVPVQILGTQDGTAWDRTAWKTEAFYGNPLAGFTAPTP